MTWMTAWMIGCGAWSPQDFETLHAGLPLECAHAQTPCESCHDPARPPGPIDGACLSCHAQERPVSHEVPQTDACGACHDACGWDPTTPHPVGFDNPELHGLAFKLADPGVGDCRSCHGEELQGGAARGCGSCHEEAGIGDWRTDCTLCHGGALEPSGAPPVDIDGLAPVSFAAHTAHVEADASYRASPCTDCHATPAAVLDAGHTLDGSPAVAEVVFADGPSPQTSWGSQTCADSYCHGNGSTDDGVVRADDPPMGCESCHATESDPVMMSGVHGIHLDGGAPAVCADCHTDVVDADGVIFAPQRHVDGIHDVAFADLTISSDDGGGTCNGVCHGVPHDGTGWGHPPDYELPEQHGLDSNLQVDDCRACHGSDLRGGSSGTSCDDCHASGWRTDCSFCHGGADGLPPEDLDNTADEALISFLAHPEHADGDAHPLWGCETCHGTASGSYFDAMNDPDHAIDATPGVAEVDFGGVAAGGSTSGGRCTVYCHGDGRSDGTQSDSSSSLACTGCHAMPPSSGEHRDHEHDDYPCAECHAQTVDTADVIIGPNQHVDGTGDVDLNSGLNSVIYNGSTCSGSCHGENHRSESW